MQKTNITDLLIDKENQNKKRHFQYRQFNRKKTVDINMLLNRVKLKKKESIKKKYILFISGSSLVAVIAFLIF
jgi:hypothetical protein